MEHVALESPHPGRAEVLYTHSADECIGEVCAIHRRSDHHMRQWHQHWRGDRKLMERICPHGVGHPDPDHMTHVTRTRSDGDAWAEGIHGCDGCCINNEELREAIYGNGA